MNGHYYLSFGQIQDKIEEYFNLTGTGLNFRDAVNELTKEGKYKTDNCIPPNFLENMQISNNDFLKLINKIPIYISEINCVNPVNDDENQTIYIPNHNNIQICRESCYAPKNFISLNSIVIIYVFHGECTITFIDSSYKLKTGELCIISPNTPMHVFTTSKDIVFNIMSDVHQFETSFLKLLQNNNLLSEFFYNALYGKESSYLFFLLVPSNEIRNIFLHLFQEFVHKDQYNEGAFYYYLQLLYINILRSHENTYKYYKKQKNIPTKTVMFSILQYINSNYHDLTLAKLASKFHYETSYLSKLIKSSTGKNYSKIITELKINESKKLLENTKLSIQQISEITGYNSSDHFSHSFKLLCGISPQGYRTLINQNKDSKY